jgi:hypothetical protein
MMAGLVGSLAPMACVSAQLKVLNALADAEAATQH